MRSPKDAPCLPRFQNGAWPAAQLRRATSRLSFRAVPLFRGLVVVQLEIPGILVFWAPEPSAEHWPRSIGEQIANMVNCHCGT